MNGQQQLWQTFGAEVDDNLRLVTAATALVLFGVFVAVVRWHRRFWRFYDHLVR